ncbi:LysR family transcriptional regulator [Permianibacter sp. IMCC34836]|uniref:LysR family transcriptional regulator n=1 Tax=Permianibacter fluminis TaxID=2738515 RepID=UPI0015541368|nr:LysR family transcriptional regulator [Permianibacter fluminis]NQD38005.1 LysR family transcriptional regulator [Permianibacter fluminis]
MDHFSEMSIFAAVADSHSLAAAARQLNQSAPTVTRAIAGLEQRLGVALLERSTRGVQLTAAGTRYLTDCKRILQEVQEAEASAAGRHATPAGVLNVSTPLLFGQDVLTPILLAYLDAYPAVHIRAHFLDRFPNLQEEGIDVALLMGELPDSSLIAVKVGSIQRVVCATPAYLKRFGVPAHPDDLHQHKLIVSTADSRSHEWQFQQTGESFAVPVTAALSTSTNTAALNACLLDAGLTRLMSYQVRDRVATGQLQLVLADFAPASLPVHVVYREGRRAAARVRSFVEFASQQLRQLTL